MGQMTKKEKCSLIQSKTEKHLEADNKKETKNLNSVQDVQRKAIFFSVSFREIVPGK